MVPHTTVDITTKRLVESADSCAMCTEWDWDSEERKKLKAVLEGGPVRHRDKLCHFKFPTDVVWLTLSICDSWSEEEDNVIYIIYHICNNTNEIKASSLSS